jgi:hypothetical protein
MGVNGVWVFCEKIFFGDAVAQVMQVHQCNE